MIYLLMWLATCLLATFVFVFALNITSGPEEEEETR